MHKRRREATNGMVVALEMNTSTAVNIDRSKRTDLVEVGDLGAVGTFGAVVGNVTSVKTEADGASATAVRDKSLAGAVKDHRVGNGVESSSRSRACAVIHTTDDVRPSASSRATLDRGGVGICGKMGVAGIKLRG